MKVTVPEISWHERDPIYSVDIQPGNHAIKRLVSAGVDKFVRVSHVKCMYVLSKNNWTVFVCVL